MLYKVWAQNCVRPKGKRIIQATPNDLEEAIQRNIDEALTQGYIDIMKDDDTIDYDKQEAAYDKVNKYFKQSKRLEAGDWMIVEVKNENEIVIPNMCSTDASFIF